MSLRMEILHTLNPRLFGNPLRQSTNEKKTIKNSPSHSFSTPYICLPLYPYPFSSFLLHALSPSLFILSPLFLLASPMNSRGMGRGKVGAME